MCHVDAGRAEHALQLRQAAGGDVGRRRAGNDRLRLRLRRCLGRTRSRAGHDGERLAGRRRGNRRALCEGRRLDRGERLRRCSRLGRQHAKFLEFGDARLQPVAFADRVVALGRKLLNFLFGIVKARRGAAASGVPSAISASDLLSRASSVARCASARCRSRVNCPTRRLCWATLLCGRQLLLLCVCLFGKGRKAALSDVQRLAVGPEPIAQAVEFALQLGIGQLDPKRRGTIRTRGTLVTHDADGRRSQHCDAEHRGAPAATRGRDDSASAAIRACSKSDRLSGTTRFPQRNKSVTIFPHSRAVYVLFGQSSSKLNSGDRRHCLKGSRPERFAFKSQPLHPATGARCPHTLGDPSQLILGAQQKMSSKLGMPRYRSVRDFTLGQSNHSK